MLRKVKNFIKTFCISGKYQHPGERIPPLPAVFFDLGNKMELHVTEYNTEIKLHKFIHFAFTVNDFDGYLEFLREKGIEYGEFSGKNMKFQTRIDGVRQIYFQDPDGYWIEVNDHQ